MEERKCTLKPLLAVDKTVDLGVEEEQMNDVIDLIHQLKPDWGISQILCKKLAGGHGSTVIKVWTKEDGDEKAVIVRVGTKTSAATRDPVSLVTAMRVAEAGGVGAPVLAQFNNGLVYGYTVGEPINPDVMQHDDHIHKLLATQLAKIDSLDPKELLGEEADRLPKEPNTFRVIKHLLSKLPQDFSEIKWGASKPECTREEIEKEFEFLQKEFNADKDDIIFSHNDAWWANAIYNKEKDTLHMIDYDFAGYNYRSMEIAYYFILGQLELIPNTIVRMHHPRESTKRKYIRYYLEAQAEIEGRSDPITDEKVEQVLQLCKVPELACTLFLILIALVVGFVHESPINYIWVSNGILKLYKSLKQEYILTKAESI